jgi:crotonobetainyl-CoA:carnitine CoA-transferase CaiB-like acyl-CoA transferase
MLSPYRVLDLTDEGALICGQVLGDLGADVILVEPPGGLKARKVGPFCGDAHDGNRSLNFWALNRNKRGITLDLETEAGRESLHELVKTADFLIESYAPGYLDRLGLGYRALAEINPRLIMISITPFGQHGPKANWAATDLTVTAASGALFITGDEDRPPVHTTVPQAYQNAGIEGAAGALIALHARERDGLGQHIDVSAQTAMMMTTQFNVLSSGWGDLSVERQGGGLKLGKIRTRFIYPCRDGHVSITFAFGAVLGPPTRRLFEWIFERGLCDEATRDKDWIGYGGLLVSGKEPLEEYERCIACVERFTLSHTKQELFDEAIQRRILLVPVSNTADMVNAAQSRAREYWTNIKHTELGREIVYPGAFAKFSEAPIRYRRRPPLLGEHTREAMGDGQPKAYTTRSVAQCEATFSDALSGLKVLDFTWAYAGPATTRCLADYGATVVRVESSKKLDSYRTVGPFKDGKAGIDRSGGFSNVNMGKLDLSLNLTLPEAREVIFRLVKWADIVIENYSPRVMRGWGMDYQSLRKLKPDIIMLSSCLNGQTGPSTMLAGYGTMGAVMAGFGELTGWPDRAPSAPFGAYTDYIAPRFSVAALLSAVDHRRRTGQGQYIDLSQSECSMHLLGPAILEYTVNGRIRGRMGNAVAEYAPSGVYPCLGTERWIAIAAPTDEAWRALCKASARGWSEDNRFANMSARLANREALDAAISEWTAGFEPDALEELLQGVGVPVHRVSSPPDTLADPQLQARKHIAYVDHPQLGAALYESSRMRFSRTPAALRWPGPQIGEHNDYVLRELLGLTDEEIANLLTHHALV